jgi:hypothetical protein
LPPEAPPEVLGEEAPPEVLGEEAPPEVLGEDALGAALLPDDVDPLLDVPELLAKPMPKSRDEAWRRARVASRLLVVLQLERRDVVVPLRPARTAGVERETYELRRHVDLGAIQI